MLISGTGHLVHDLDDVGDFEMSEVEEVYDALFPGAFRVLYTTRSHGPGNHRYRVVLPLQDPIRGYIHRPIWTHEKERVRDAIIRRMWRGPHGDELRREAKNLEHLEVVSEEQTRRLREIRSVLNSPPGDIHRKIVDPSAASPQQPQDLPVAWAKVLIENGHPLDLSDLIKKFEAEHNRKVAQKAWVLSGRPRAQRRAKALRQRAITPFVGDPEVGRTTLSEGLSSNTKLVPAMHGVTYLRSAGIHVGKGGRHHLLNQILWHSYRAGIPIQDIDRTVAEVVQHSRDSDRRYLSSDATRLLRYYEREHEKALPRAHGLFRVLALGLRQPVGKDQKEGGVDAAVWQYLSLLARYNTLWDPEGAPLDQLAVATVTGLSVEFVTALRHMLEEGGAYRVEGDRRDRRHFLVEIEVPDFEVVNDGRERRRPVVDEAEIDEIARAIAEAEHRS